MSFAGVMALAAVNWVIPWLGRRGDLNAIVEGIIQSALSVPVVVENIVTEPFSELTVTRLESVKARAEERFQFGAGSIAIYYEPLSLLAGRIERVVFQGPHVFINLNANLEDIPRVPRLPPGTVPRERAPREDQVLPFTVGRTVVNEGSLTLRLGKRDLDFSRLSIEVSRLGESRGQTIMLSVEGLGGTVRVRGGLDTTVEEGRPIRWTFHDATVALEGIEISKLLEWVAPDVAGGSIAEPVIRARGRVALEGTITGTWPEEVKLDLSTSATGLSGSYGADVAVTDARVGLHLAAVVLGDAATVKFHVSTEGTGTVNAGSGGVAEDGSVDVRGTFERFSRDGALHLESSRLAFRDLGELTLSGDVTSLLGDGPPAIDLSVELPSLNARSAFSRLHPALLERIIERRNLEGIEGKVHLSAHATGSVLEPRFDGSFALEEGQVPLPGDETLACSVEVSFDSLELDDGGGWLLGHAMIDGRGIEAQTLACIFGLAGVEAAGSLRAHVELEGLRFPAETIDIDLHARGGILWTGGALEKRESDFGATRIQAMTTFTVVGCPERRVEMEVDAEASLAELLAGRLYAVLEGNPISLHARGEAVWNENGGIHAISVEELGAHTPLTGRARGNLHLVSDGGEANGGGFRVKASFEVPEIPAGEAFRVLVRDPFQESIGLLEGASLVGKGALSFRAEGPLRAPRASGRLRLAARELSLEGIRAEGVAVEVPFAHEPTRSDAPLRREAGFIRLERIDAGPVSLEQVHLPFHLEQGKYHLDAPSRFSVLDGVIELRSGTLALSPGGLSVSSSVLGRDIRVGKLARAHGVEAFQGSLSFDFDPIALEGSLISSRGGVLLNAFGGQMSFTDLSVNNAFEPYFDLQLREGRVRDVRLADVGEVFHFGLMSGVLQGTVNNLQVTGGELTSFLLDVETVPVSGVPQYLNRSAIDSIRRITSGPFGLLEETFFSKFRFADFGFTCELEDGVFRLRGKYTDGKVEYVMRPRWYQFPRVTIINGYPEMPYDWRSIVLNLRQIYNKDSEKN